MADDTARFAREGSMISDLLSTVGFCLFVDRVQAIIGNIGDLDEGVRRSAEPGVLKDEDAERRVVILAELGVAIGAGDAASILVSGIVNPDKGSGGALLSAYRGERRMALLKCHDPGLQNTNRPASTSIRVVPAALTQT